MQRQIGHNLRLPGSLLSDDFLDPKLVVQSSGDEMKRVQADQEAYIKSQTEVALSRAKNASARTQVEFTAGETVYVYRQPKERKRKRVMTPEAHEGRKPSWVGPGIILAVERPSLWVSMKGELWKVSFEQCRHATSEEQIAKELLAGELEALREELGRRAEKRTFRDMTDQGLPGEDDEVPEPGVPEPRGDHVPEPPAVRQRVAGPHDVQSPDNDTEYSPDMEDLEPNPPAPNPLPAQGESFERARTESEPEPLPTPRPLDLCLDRSAHISLVVEADGLDSEYALDVMEIVSSSQRVNTK